MVILWPFYPPTLIRKARKNFGFSAAPPITVAGRGSCGAKNILRANDGGSSGASPSGAELGTRWDPGRPDFRGRIPRFCWGINQFVPLFCSLFDPLLLAILLAIAQAIRSGGRPDGFRWMVQWCAWLNLAIAVVGSEADGAPGQGLLARQPIVALPTSHNWRISGVNVKVELVKLGGRGLCVTGHPWGKVGGRRCLRLKRFVWMRLETW